MTAGEFSILTGLSAKALRLYRERGILSPAFVEPDTGYRYYDRSQLRQGQVTDLLRRANVPLAELAAAGEFDFEGRRERLALQRMSEDFYLDVAQRVCQFEPQQLQVHRAEAPPVDWIGVVWRFGVPSDLEESIGVFAVLAGTMPLLDEAFRSALQTRGLLAGEVSWTAEQEGTGVVNQRETTMVMARPAARALHAGEAAEIADEVSKAGDENVSVVSGRLPRRLEITFTPSSKAELSTEDEAALDYQRSLAFDHYRREHDLIQIGRFPRPVLTGPDGEHTTVFDVELR
nr:MerR family transcriptional regulator [Kineosporia babensis]